ncbi:MAG: DeoR family transcriptional regulator [Anaerolineae bacterium]|nr:DeoR family transcriptional regulator [Anaerolineae bacterium]
MLLVQREAEILAFINKQGVATVRELAELCRVTEVTIRRDLKRLEILNLIERTHGGAISLEKPLEQRRLVEMEEETRSPDALVLTPLQTRSAHTLREKALRNRIPLIAEGVPQEGAIYLGCDNYAGAYEMGIWAGEYFRQHCSGTAQVLDISLNSLPNTRERSAGFIDGMHHVLGDEAHCISIDGQGLFNNVYQIATDALRLHPEVNVIFGINDDSVLGGIQAYLDLGRDPQSLVAVGFGGEGKTVFDALMRGGPLKACVAMFPEVVGRLAVDAAAYLWNGGTIETDILTPTVILTPDNISTYYTPSRHGWDFVPDSLNHRLRYPWLASVRRAHQKHLSFLIIYRTHEWYQNVTKAMQQRSAELGVAFSVVDMNEDIRAEIRELRRLIGKLAASYVNDGEKIILDSGSTTTFMAHFLKGYHNLSVITNSYDVFQQLRTEPGIHLTLTGGDFDPESQSFVGRSAQLLLQEIRADKAFIVAGGLSASFGLSSVNQQEAEVRRVMIRAAREVIVLADHTVLDVDSNVRVTGLDDVDTVITDAGVLSSQSFEFTQRGLKVLVAGRVVPSS